MPSFILKYFRVAVTSTHSAALSATLLSRPREQDVSSGLKHAVSSPRSGSGPQPTTKSWICKHFEPIYV